MPFKQIGAQARTLAAGLLLLALLAHSAAAGPYLVVDASTGETLIENQATEPWFPASLTKLMTTYVALDAVRQGRLTMDTPLVMSLRAARMAPTKMGFEPGSEVTLDNALKMLMVKSPNDIAVMIAEGISGSVEDFADEMNAAAKKLGLQESHFVNPNGLHDPEHVSSARDMALIARALLTEFPEHQDLFDIGALLLSGVVIRNHNGLLYQYAGADGMKTGFTCSSGFNIVASATRDGHKLIAVVMGWPSARERNLQTAELLERGFAQVGHGPSVADLPKSKETQAPDMRSRICSRRNAAALEAAEEEVFGQPKPAVAVIGIGKGAAALAVAPQSLPSPGDLLLRQPVRFDPVPVFVGPKPGWTGPVLAARPAPSAASDASAYTSATAKSPPAEAPLVLQGVVKPPEAAAAAVKKAAHEAAHADHAAVKVKAKAQEKSYQF
jgi:D-alanyl-D-alanine carboxypeptidase